MTRGDSEARGIPAPLYAVAYLPGGLVSGFISVTLGYILGHAGVSVAAVAGLVSLYLLPTTWSFLVGPIVDVSLTPRRWYVIMNLATVGCFIAFALTPMSAAALPILSVLCFGASAAAVCSSSAMTAAMAATTTPRERGPIAGWHQTANLGGTGLGGGLGLWLAGHAGGPAVAALTMGAITLACAIPISLMRIPARTAGVDLPEKVTGIGRDLWAFARTRTGILAIIVMLIPCALGASAGLLPAAAGEWHASADLVALMRGALGGATTIPGCIVGGYLCSRFRHRTVYGWGALAYGFGLAAMAVAPHTPFFFGAFLILNGVILGVAFGGLTSIIFDALGPTSPATIGASLNSLCNVPLLAATVILGAAEARTGVNGMLLTEGGLGVASITAYAVLAWCWREAGAIRSQPIVAMAA